MTNLPGRDTEVLRQYENRNASHVSTPADTKSLSNTTKDREVEKELQARLRKHNIWGEDAQIQGCIRSNTLPRGHGQTSDHTAACENHSRKSCHHVSLVRDQEDDTISIETYKREASSVSRVACKSFFECCMTEDADGEFARHVDVHRSTVNSQHAHGKGATGKSEEAVRNVQNAFDVDNQVIEQWYADPYERIDLDGPAYDEWRRTQLTLRLSSQGFNKTFTKKIVSWLMRCKGHFKPMEGRRENKIRRNIAGEEGKRNADQETLKTCLKDQCHTKNITEGGPDPVEHNDPGSNQDVSDSDDDMSDGDSVASDKVSSNSFLHQEILSALAAETSSKQGPDLGEERSNRSDVRSNVKPDNAICDPDQGRTEKQQNWMKSSRDEKIAVIKHRLRTFNIVYGGDIPQSDDKTFGIDFLNRITCVPRRVPRSGCRTQGHSKLQKVKLETDNPALSNHLIDSAALTKLTKNSTNYGLNHNQTVPHKPEVYTEDPDFGLTVFPQNLITSVKDSRSRRAQFSGINIFDEQTLLKLSLSHDPDLDFQRRTAEAQTHEEERQTVLAQIRQKVFDWETLTSMKGIWDHRTERGKGDIDTAFHNDTCDTLTHSSYVESRLVSSPPVLEGKDMLTKFVPYTEVTMQAQQYGRWATNEQKAKRKANEIDINCERSNKRLRFNA